VFAIQRVTFILGLISRIHIVARQIMAWNKALQFNPGNSPSLFLNSCMKKSTLKRWFG